jgi:hypothetical protein
LAARCGLAPRLRLLILLGVLVDGTKVHRSGGRGTAAKARDDVAKQEYLTADVPLSLLGRSELLRY